MGGREAHSPELEVPAGAAREEVVDLEPTHDDVPMPERIVELPVAKGPGGAPLRVLVRKLDAAEITICIGENPGARARALGANRRPGETRAQRFARMSAAERKKVLDEFKGEAEALVLMAAVEPVFYRGRKAPDPRPVDDAGRRLAVAPLAALFEEDRTVLYEAILELAAGGRTGGLEGEDGKGGTEAARLAEFPPEHEGGDPGGGGNDPALPAREPAA